MKNVRTKVNIIAIAAVIAVTLISIAGVGGVARSHQSGQSNDSADYVEVRDALRRGGLREAAKLKGHYVQDFDPNWDFGRFDIEKLTKNSTIVVVGVPTQKVGSHLTRSGQSIVTEYEVVVKEAIKGAVSQGSTINVLLPGGRVEVEDGTSAELRTPTFEHMKVNSTYTLFLSESENDQGAYVLTGGPQGLVEIVNERTIKSHGRETDPVSAQVKDKSKESFLEEVRDSAEKWPQPGKCCR